ncbi:YsnF/AvaK domain-containing protein [Psychrobacter pygoscelis]|uniref:YsnF/AvaK domain-containing protein n=1 Tax=Psychrobacter pygoscelis TaxID=2488563 RepID=UPI003BFA00D6
MSQSNDPNNTPNKLFSADDISINNQTTTTTTSTDEANQVATNLEIDPKREQVGRLELLEERAVVNKERLDVGKVTVTKHQRTKTIEVPIELVEEVLTIQTFFEDAESEALLTGAYDEKDILRHVEPALGSVAVVNINGNRVEVGNEPVEIVLSRQVATIAKETYAVQQIDVEKSVHTHTDNIAVELKYEELDVKEEGFLDHKE